MARKLPEKHTLFAQLYAELLNATEAYRRLYPDCKNPDCMGPRLEAKLRARGFLQPFLEEKLRKMEEKIDAESVDRRLEEMLAFDPAKMFGPDGHLLPLNQMPKEIRLAFAGWDDRLKKFKFPNKLDALRLWYQRKGLLREQVDLNLKDKEVKPADVTPEELEAVAALRHEVRAKKKGSGSA